MKKVIFALAAVGLASAANAQFYGGDFNQANGLASERDDGLGIGNSAYTYDNFNWSGGPVATVFGNFLQNIGQISGGEYEIRQVGSVGNKGALVTSGNSVISWVKKDAGGFGLEQWTLTLNGGNFPLPAGSYVVGVRPVGSGSGRAFAACTDGVNGIGGPLNDDVSFFDSAFFAVNYGKATDQVGAGNGDFSYGITTPAPGALSLLGLGGLMAARRRR